MKSSFFAVLQQRIYFEWYCCIKNILNLYKGATSIEKIHEVKLHSGLNFLNPSPSLKKGPTNENVDIMCLLLFTKYIFSNFNLPYFLKKPNLTNFTIELAPK